MLHEPAVTTGKDLAFPFKRKLGARLFIAYALFYAGFVAINLAKPALMEKTVFMGLNLAVVYGFGLIIVALILALIYSRACLKKEREMKGADAAGRNA
ncbi:MAG: DUF485 domain-containing protein [Candidatus Aminicenantes bacterium]|nr:DUF485 domain-containing protein [Candidatus Aminicenantes bacterium]